jgi:hypothetical protein
VTAGQRAMSLALTDSIGKQGKRTDLDPTSFGANDVPGSSVRKARAVLRFSPELARASGRSKKFRMLPAAAGRFHAVLENVEAELVVKPPANLSPMTPVGRLCRRLVTQESGAVFGVGELLDLLQNRGGVELGELGHIAAVVFRRRHRVEPAPGRQLDHAPVPSRVTSWRAAADADLLDGRRERCEPARSIDLHVRPSIIDVLSQGVN